MAHSGSGPQTLFDDLAALACRSGVRHVRETRDGFVTTRAVDPEDPVVAAAEDVVVAAAEDVPA